MDSAPSIIFGEAGLLTFHSQLTVLHFLPSPYFKEQARERFNKAIIPYFMGLQNGNCLLPDNHTSF